MNNNPGHASTTGVVHFAGLDIQVGQHLRQRCAWCGAVLLDYDLTRIAVPTGQDPRPSTWTVGTLVQVDGNISCEVPHEDGQQIPTNSCGQLPADVTV